MKQCTKNILFKIGMILPILFGVIIPIISFNPILSYAETNSLEQTVKETKSLSQKSAKMNGITGNEAIARSGLVPSHVENFKKVASEKETYILFRPVNKLSTSLIQKGAATKGMEVHGKSSNWGPMAGYIPFDQDLSKKYGNEGAVKKGNQDNEESIKEQHGSDQITKIILTLEPERIEELKKENIMKEETEKQEGNKLYHFFDVNNESYEFRMDKQTRQVQYKTKNGQKTTLGQEIKEWTFVEVMAKVVDGEAKALTADYDLFALTPSLSQIQKRIPNNVWNQLGDDTSLEKDEKRIQLLRQYGLTRENKNDGKGVLTEWQRELIEPLNSAAREAGYTGGTVVNHGTEQDNTEFPEQDKEIFIITPDGETILTTSWEETQNFVEDNIINQGYVFYHNKSYNTIAPGNQVQIPWKECIPTSDELAQIYSKDESALARAIKLAQAAKELNVGYQTLYFWCNEKDQSAEIKFNPVQTQKKPHEVAFLSFDARSIS